MVQVIAVLQQFSLNSMWLSLKFYNQRLFTCNNCKSFIEERCKHCGCYMKYKAILPHTVCPENKWPNKFEILNDKPDWFDKIL